MAATLGDSTGDRRPRVGAAPGVRLATALVSWLCAALPAAGQVLVDDFSTDQGLAVVAPGTTDGSSVTGAGMIGGSRDALIELGSGEGPVSLQVASGDLAFAVADGSTGKALLTWDADTDPLVLDPIGLSGANLTTAGARAFRLGAQASGAPVDVVIEVFTNGGNSSRGALRIPVGPAQDRYLPFSELIPAQGAGADFANVGAITLTLGAAGVAPSTELVLTLVDTVPPALAATKVDALTGDLDADSLADPGDTVTYTITISNTGGEALSVDLSDTVDPNTTLVAGSVSSTPIAKGEQYRTVGNVSLVADGTPPRVSLLANDDDPDGDPITVSAIDSLSARGGSIVPIDLAAGTFTYTPAGGVRGVDTFGYTIEDDDGNSATATATILVEGIVWFVDNTHTACVPTPCGSGTQADPFGTAKQAETASAPGDLIRFRQGDGTVAGQDQGFVLKAGQRLVGGATDLVIGGELIEAGAGPTGHSVHSHGGGTVLELASDTLIEGMRLLATTDHGAAGEAQSNVTLENVIIETSNTAGGVNLGSHSGGFAFANSTIISTGITTGVAVEIGNGTGSFTFSGSTISHDGGGLIHVQNGNAATVDFSGSNPSLTNGSDDGILLANNTGGSTFTFDAIGDVGTGAGDAIRITGSGTVNLATVGNLGATGGAALDVSTTTLVKIGGPGAITFASLASTGGAVGMRLSGVAPAVAVNGATTVNGAAGIDLQGSGAVSFNGQLAVTSTAGPGIVAANTATVSVLDNTSTLSATGGPGLDVVSTPLAMSFASLSATPGGGGRGVSLVGASGALTANGGSVTGGTAGTAFHVDGGSATVSYGGTVTQNNAQRVVDIADTTGGGIGFNGKVTGGQSSTGVRIHNADGDASFADLDLGTAVNRLAATALSLSGGSAGTFAFADTQIFTDGATGLDANNGGTLEVTGAGNRVDTSNGIALGLTGGTTIGANGVTFQRVDASGSTHGIRLHNAGSGFTVTGIATTDGSGGTIQNVSERGVEVLGTNGISLANMALTNAATTDGVANCDNLVNTGCHAAIHLDTVTTANLDNLDIDGSVQQGLNGVNVSALSLAGSTILNAGDEVNEGCLQVFGLSGNSDITNSDLGFPAERVAYVRNVGTGNLSLTVSNSTFRDTQSSGLGADGLELAFFSNSIATIDVVDSAFRRNATSGLQVISEDTSVVGLDVTGSTFDREAGIGIGMDLATADSGSLTFNVIGNPLINSNGSTAVNVFSIGPSTIRGRINNNPDVQAGGAGTGGFGIRVQVNENASGIVEISGNTISNIGNDAGIQAIARGLAGAACGTGCTAGRLDATINNNNVTIDPLGLYDVWVQANDSNTTCANVTNNSGSSAGIAAFRERTNAASSTVLLQGFDTNATTTWNNNGNTPVGSVSSSNNGTLAGGTCSTVSHPLP